MCASLENSCFNLNKKHVAPLVEQYIKGVYENMGYPFTDSATVPSQTFESTQLSCCLPSPRLG